MTSAVGEIAIGASKQQAILTLLLLQQGSPVTTDGLITDLWPEGPPATARTSLQTYVYRLRRILRPLEGVHLATHGSGYALTVPDGSLDTERFERSVDAGAAMLAQDEAARAAEHLRDALALWRGPLLPDADLPVICQERERLANMHVNAHELLLDAELRTGLASRVIPDLERLVRVHPFREGLWAMLIRALAKTGRRAEALTAYQRVRDLLAQELGIEPSEELRRLQDDILHARADAFPAG
ncbi:BTAD domain-containing putative transcriptional regulator [Nonomuraea sp. NPDC048826]|uniref:AfsR/SARP family transcriptional regulator n=1 Tax=Nonomuraea sp. NPDC048826 TaxID=3364347 RepID=UPI00371BE710